MKRLLNRSGLTRRLFLRRTAAGAGLLSALGAAVGSPHRLAAAAPTAAPAANPYAYDIEALKKVDPDLIHFQEAGRIRSPQSEPRRLVVGPDGAIYVAGGNSVVILDGKGNRKTEINAGAPVRAVAVAADGLVYLGVRDHIEVFDAKGGLKAAWETPAAKTWFASLAAGENHLFASDAGNRLVLRYDRSGKLLGRMGEKSKDAKRSTFIVPSPYFDLEIGPDGLLWVVNPGQHRLEGYTFDGALETSWGEASFGIKGFCGCCNPSYFTRFPDGRFVTSEKGLPRIKVYSAKGEFESVVAGPELFPKYLENLNSNPVGMDVAVDSSGQVLVADLLGGDVRIFKRTKEPARV